MDVTPRMQTFIRLLASDNDGEVVNAARALHRALQAQGADFHALVDRLPTRARAQPRQERAYREPPRQERRQAKASHADKLEWLLKQPYAFRQNEREFLENIRKWDGELTEKQAKWFGDIYAKAKAKASAECGF